MLFPRFYETGKKWDSKKREELFFLVWANFILNLKWLTDVHGDNSKVTIEVKEINDDRKWFKYINVFRFFNSISIIVGYLMTKEIL